MRRRVCDIHRPWLQWFVRKTPRWTTLQHLKQLLKQLKGYLSQLMSVTSEASTMWQKPEPYTHLSASYIRVGSSAASRDKRLWYCTCHRFEAVRIQPHVAKLAWSSALIWDSAQLLVAIQQAKTTTDGCGEQAGPNTDVDCAYFPDPYSSVPGITYSTPPHVVIFIWTLNDDLFTFKVSLHIRQWPDRSWVMVHYTLSAAKLAQMNSRLPPSPPAYFHARGFTRNVRRYRLEMQPCSGDHRPPTPIPTPNPPIPTPKSPIPPKPPIPTPIPTPIPPLPNLTPNVSQIPVQPPFRPPIAVNYHFREFIPPPVPKGVHFTFLQSWLNGHVSAIIASKLGSWNEVI